jgi:NADPH:quinone reductase-like Zn-dependent oxidoreductase
MKAIQVNSSQHGAKLVPAEIAKPEPQEGEVLIRVHAAGVTPTELLWYPTTHTKDGAARTNAVPGHEFSGVVEAIGKHVSGFDIGDEVYGMNDWFADGATAEFCITVPQNIAPKPASLTHEAAATVPIGALTAFQGLVERAKVVSGERVLVHGGAGAVGLYAVQLAHLRGAYVIATASAHNRDFVKQLGANDVIDYKASPFEEEVRDVDVVFDAVGGATLDRSWRVLKPNGRMVTIAADSESTNDQRIKDAFFIVEPNREQLIEIGQQLDAGRLKAFVNGVVALNEASVAYSGTLKEKRGYGKVVVSISA